MRMSDIPFGTTDWASIEPTQHPGESGSAIWRTQNFGAIRVRMVDYSAGPSVWGVVEARLKAALAS